MYLEIVVVLLSNELIEPGDVIEYDEVRSGIHWNI